MRRSLFLTLVAFAGAVHAQTYPARPIRSIMTVAGGADIIARLVARGLTTALGQPGVVESQSGAGGAIGAEAVSRPAADRFTILLTSASALVVKPVPSQSAAVD